ncbi:HAD family hydrolase [Insolitispirillum peregrinum]|uniref:HAD family hydrolase n=1 Tax=Insolitispirillum peregrinum TaxID=80876 RepID=UPI0036183E2E
MPLALFDLDDTLIAGDSATLWLRFLVAKGLADAAMLPQEAEMMRAYREGALKMEDYMRFTLQPLAGRRQAEVAGWVERFIAQEISPIIYPQARETLARYQQDGWRCVVISATGEHLVQRIAAHLGVSEALAIQLEQDGERYSGDTTGILTYQQGKVDRLHAWLAEHDETLAGSHGYSDSINDVPLLTATERAFVVNPDPRLADHAQAHGWLTLDWNLS